MISKSTKVLLVILVAAAGIVYWWSGRQAGDGAEVPIDAYPPGRWARIPAEADAEDLAAVLSLPYLQGKIEAGDSSGVVTYDPDRAYAGLNLYCSGHGPEAILMDMEGRPLHRWHLRFRDAFPNSRIIQESAFFRRVALLDDGYLLALFHGTGLIKLDRDSNLIWALDVAGFNDFFVEGDGRILMLAKEARIIPEINPDTAVLEDFVVEISPQGKVLGRTSILAAFRQAPWSDLLATMRDEGDILHSNTITRLAGPIGEGPFVAGNLLVSLREVDVVGVLDAAGENVLWGQRGTWRRQHEPALLPGGSILLFDNKGGPGGSTRVLGVEPASGEILWSYGEAADQAIYSPEGGTAARLPNGNTLITASESGTVREIDPQGEIVWEFLSPHRAGPDGQLVATIWEVQRLEPARVDWLH